jgi:membrane protein
MIGSYPASTVDSRLLDPDDDAMWNRLKDLYRNAAQGRLAEANTRWAKALLETTHAGHVIFRSAVRDRLAVRASMLAYWTTVAMVPLFLLAFALMRPLGLTEETESTVRNFLLRTIVAGSTDELTGLLSDIFASANFGTMGVLGVAGVMGFGMQLYSKVERAYSDIFGVRVRRSWLQRFTIFYSAVTLAPILLAMGVIASRRLTNLSGGEITLAARLVPLLFTSAVLIGAVKQLPCVRVSWRAALVGGFSSAVLFELSKSGFIWHTTLFGTRDTMKVLYGSLGFLPVFLLWLYVLWLVVLVGVEIAYHVEHWKPLMDAQRRRAVDPHDERRQPDGFFALYVMSAISERYLRGEGPATIEYLSDDLRAYPNHIQLVADVLVDAGLLVETEEQALVPARPPHMIEAKDVIRAWRELAVPILRPEVAGARLVDDGVGALEGALATSLVGSGAESG